MSEAGVAGIGRGGQSARRGGMALFDAAPAEAEDARKAAKSNIYGTMAFSEVEKENEVCDTECCNSAVSYGLLFATCETDHYPLLCTHHLYHTGSDVPKENLYCRQQLQ